MPRPKLKIKGATIARGATYTRIITVATGVLSQAMNMGLYIPRWYIDGLVQDCGNSSALAMELLQSCIEPSSHVSLCVLQGLFNPLHAGTELSRFN